MFISLSTSRSSGFKKWSDQHPRAATTTTLSPPGAPLADADRGVRAKPLAQLVIVTYATVHAPSG